MRRVLQLAPYRRLLAAYTLNQLALIIGELALSYAIYRHTGSALGAMLFFLLAQFVPAFLSPAVVARIDRNSPRRTLPALYALEAVAFLALAWFTSHFTLVLILILTLIDGVIAITARALARSATTEVTTAAGLLREGNALANTLFSISFMAAPAISGAIIVAASPSVALIANGVLFGVMAITLASASDLPGALPDPGPATGRLRAALRLARERPEIRVLLGLEGICLLFFAIPTPVEVVFAQHTLHAGAGGYGALVSAWGGGAVAGSAIYARWHGLPARELIVLGTFGLGAGFVAMALAPTLAIAIAGSAIAGIGNGVEVVAARTALQEQVEQRWMALMMGLWESMFMSVPGIGIVLGGVVTQLSGTRSALALAGAGSVAMSAAGWVVLRPRLVQTLPRIEHAPADGASGGSA